MRAKTAASACIVVALALLLAGCSGGGRDAPAQVQPAGTFLSDQATLLTLDMAWLPVLFPVSFNPGAGTVEPVVNDPTESPDGTFTWIFTNSDGSQQTWTLSADGTTSDGRVVFPDGKVLAEHVVATGNADGSSDTAITDVFPDGSHLDRNVHIPLFEGESPGRLLNSQTGQMTLPGGRHLDFTLSVYHLHGVLQVDAHEGWVYNLDAPNLPDQTLPDTARPAAGSLTRGTVVTQFTLPANPGGEQWRAMTLTAPGGITGTYALDVVLTGTGTVKEDGQILLTAVWGSSGVVTGTFADGHSEVGQPSAAARDFLIDRWLWALGAFGPNPR